MVRTRSSYARGGMHLRSGRRLAASRTPPRALEMVTRRANRQVAQLPAAAQEANEQLDDALELLAAQEMVVASPFVQPAALAFDDSDKENVPPAAADAARRLSFGSLVCDSSPVLRAACDFRFPDSQNLSFASPAYSAAAHAERNMFVLARVAGTRERYCPPGPDGGAPSRMPDSPVSNVSHVEDGADETSSSDATTVSEYLCGFCYKFGCHRPTHRRGVMDVLEVLAPATVVDSDSEYFEDAQPDTVPECVSETTCDGRSERLVVDDCGYGHPVGSDDVRVFASATPSDYSSPGPVPMRRFSDVKVDSDSEREEEARIHADIMASDPNHGEVADGLRQVRVQLARQTMMAARTALRIAHEHLAAAMDADALSPEAYMDLWSEVEEAKEKYNERCNDYMEAKFPTEFTESEQQQREADEEQKQKMDEEDFNIEEDSEEDN